MLIFPGLALGGAIATVALVRHRTPPLLDLLAAGQPPDKQDAAQDELAEEVRARLAKLDERYQAWIQSHIDPWLAKSMHDRQMLALTQGGQRQLGKLEKDMNRCLIPAVTAIGLVGLEALSGLVLSPFVVAIGLWTVWPAVKENYRIAVEEHRLSILHLLLGYTFGLWFGGTYLAAVGGLMLNMLGAKVQLLTQVVTRHSLSHLFGEQPAQVWVVVDGVEMQIPFGQLRMGDILVLDAGQPVPVDGVVVQGTAMLDQHRLTGESEPVEKSAGDPVLAATLVLGGRIRVRVEKTGAETTAGRIGDILNRTVDRQEMRLADYFKDVEHTMLPTLAAGVLGWAIRGPRTGLALMGCNYLVGTISLRLLVMLNSLSLAARRGILIKDGRALEVLDAVDTLVFDKTGTLTLERQQVVRIHAAPAWEEAEVLRLAAAVEHRQTHPIAQAIVRAAAVRGLALAQIDESHYEIGAGLKARLDGRLVLVGSQRFLAAEGISLPETLSAAQHASQAKGHSMVFVTADDTVAGCIELSATLRPEAEVVVEWLRNRGLALYILSGDQEGPTRKLAGQLAMDGYFANTLPEQKAEKVKQLQAQGRRVCFVGDGINDAVALLQADVSISFRGATTVASDAAQVVLMEDHLEQIPVLMELARGYQRNIDGIARRAKGYSVAAGTGVLLWPRYQFYVVPLLWAAQLVASLYSVSQPMLKESESL